MYVIEGKRGDSAVYIEHPFIGRSKTQWTTDIESANLFETSEQALSARFIILTVEIDVDDIVVKPRAWSTKDIEASGPYCYVLATMNGEKPKGMPINGLTAHKALDRFVELGKDFFQEDFLDKVTVEFDADKGVIRFRLPTYNDWPHDPFLSKIH